MPESLIRMENITMEFPGVKALDQVSFDAKAGEVHVILGENGAGKSTITKILAGVHKKTEGTIYIDGELSDYSSIHEAKEKGISMIFQELQLIPHLTVAENIFLGKEPAGKAGISWKKMNEETTKLLEHLGLNIKATDVVKYLGVGQQQMVEIIKAISNDSRIIIMDEPTAALTESEINELFQIINELKSKNVCVIYISHRMAELLEIGDRVTVLRDGKYVGTVDVENTSLDELITMMVGRSLEQQYPKERIPAGEIALKVENISCNETGVKDVSFEARRGEVVGFAGLMGAGRTELMRAVFGADKIDEGVIYIHGNEIQIKHPIDAIQNKIGLLTEDRKAQGLNLKMGIDQNITLPSLSKITGKINLNLKREKVITKEQVDSLSIKTPSLVQKAKYLSGGNQQKVVLAKWLVCESDIVIFDEPTRGIDVGAKVEIYKVMNKLAARGAAVIMVSSELPEILGMSDRIYVMREGRITGELNYMEATQENIMSLATGGK